MKKKIYKVLPLRVTGTQAFAEASAEELRVLVALVEFDGVATTAEELAERASTSLSRTKASITLWESEGVVKSTSEDSNLYDEFEFVESADNRREMSSLDLAETIRDNKLKELQEEISLIIGKGSMNKSETEAVTSLSTELGLSAEYIVTLASHLMKRYETKSVRLTAFRIKNEALKLTAKDITTLEELERYIAASERDTKDESEIRQVLGIYNRAIVKSEKEYYRKWTGEYCFGPEIISEAMDIAVVNTAKNSIKYVDGILTSWYKAGCKTLEDCKKHDAANLEERARRRSERSKNSKTEPKTPKYGNFDPNAAFLAALDRSYSDDTDN